MHINFNVVWDAIKLTPWFNAVKTLIYIVCDINNYCADRK